MEVFNSPIVVVCVLLMPIIVIGLAKSWKRFKTKRAEGASTGSSGST